MCDVDKISTFFEGKLYFVNTFSMTHCSKGIIKALRNVWRAYCNSVSSTKCLFTANCEKSSLVWHRNEKVDYSVNESRIIVIFWGSRILQSSSILEVYNLIGAVGLLTSIDPLTNDLKYPNELIRICGIFGTNLVFKNIIKICGIWLYILDEDKFTYW